MVVLKALADDSSPSASPYDVRRREEPVAVEDLVITTRVPGASREPTPTEPFHGFREVGHGVD